MSQTTPSESGHDSYRTNDHNLLTNQLHGWGEEHGVYPELLPVTTAVINPITTLAKLRGYIDSLPQTKDTYTTTSLAENNVISRSQFGIIPSITFLSELAGSWRVNEHRGSSTEYINPRYAHIESLNTENVVTDDSERVELLEFYARYGVFNRDDIRLRFGLSTSGFESFRERTEFDWQARKEAGNRRTGQTWETLRSWGYSSADIGDAFGYEGKSVRKYISRTVPDSFTPPSDPTTDSS